MTRIWPKKHGYTNEEVDGNAKNGIQQNTGRQSAKVKKQQTIEEAFDGAEGDSEINAQINGDGGNKVNGNAKNGIRDGKKNAFDEVKADAGEVKKAAEEEQEKKTRRSLITTTPSSRTRNVEVTIPSLVLEKGIIYFVFGAPVTCGQARRS